MFVTMPKIQKQDGNEKIAFKKFRNGQRMKKSTPIIRGRESETFIPGNGREREFPLSPAISAKKKFRSRNALRRTSVENEDRLIK